MRVLDEKKVKSVFPMKVKCRHIIDVNGYSYGNKADFCGHWLEIEAEDIVMHLWFKYPNYEGIDYGVICPKCGMFVHMPVKDNIPLQVRENAKEVSLTNGQLTGFTKNANMETFHFDIEQHVEIKAMNVSDALRRLREKYPDLKDVDIIHVIYDGMYLPYESSKLTGEFIYYIPGCVEGKTYCIHDPMCDIAADCEHQSDMTPDKWKGCEIPEDDEDCTMYDDECK